MKYLITIPSILALIIYFLPGNNIKKYTGIITDSNNLPISNVKIIVENFKTSKVIDTQYTDTLGRYNISFPDTVNSLKIRISKEDYFSKNIYERIDEFTNLKFVLEKIEENDLADFKEEKELIKGVSLLNKAIKSLRNTISRRTEQIKSMRACGNN